MDEKFFVASCVFTEEYPELSRKIQAYITKTFNLPIIRCCVANYKVEEFENRMPDWYRDEWRNIKHFEKFPAGSTMVSICHNCSAIFEERHSEINLQSIWELILEDENFHYPNHGGEEITIQDCWRSKENISEQKAVREILRRIYCAQIKPDKVVAYCHYCVRGLRLGGKKTYHLAEFLFE